MLAANVCASDFLKEHGHPALYRIHEGPTPEKLEKVRGFMAEFGFALGGGDTPHAKDYGKLLEHIKGRPDEQLLQTVLLRSMQQAVYSPDNVGHFGLAYEHYTHFTSPIRRYPDLLIHRAINAVLEDRKYKAGDWHALGMHCSLTERRADDATRDVETWLKCFYMQDKVGETFNGTVAGVTSFGLFVALDEVYVEGLLHVTELGNDYFNFDAMRHEMAGERTGVRYRLGDRLRVKVARVDMETSKIDFVLDQLPAMPVSTPTQKPAKMPAAKPVAKPGIKPAAKSRAKPAAKTGGGARPKIALPTSSKGRTGEPSSTRGKSKSKSTRSRKGTQKK